MIKCLNRHGFKTLLIAASLLCIALPAIATDMYLKPDYTTDDRRILAACPSQPNIYEGISPKVDWKGFAERDLAILELTDRHVHLVTIMGSKIQQISVSQKNAEWFRRMSDCGPNDKYVLIGKDGGVKRRWNGQLEVDDLFQTIDAMPMRQFEIQTRSRN